MKISTINQVALFEEDGVLKFKSTVAKDTVMILRNKRLNQCRTIIVEDVSEDTTEVQFRLQGGQSIVFEAEKFNSEFEIMMFLQTPTDVKMLSQMKEAVDNVAKVVYNKTQQVAAEAYNAVKDTCSDLSEGKVEMPEADEIKENLKATKDKVVETVTSDETKEAIKEFFAQGKKLFSKGLKVASRALDKVSEAMEDAAKSTTSEGEPTQSEDEVNVKVDFKSDEEK